MVIQERYHGVAMAANTTLNLTGSGIGGFVCVTAGTLTVQVVNAAGATVTLINAFPVSAGQVYGIPLFTGTMGSASVVLAGGASGTLLKQ